MKMEEGAERFWVSWSNSVTRSKDLKNFIEMPRQGQPISGALSKPLLEDTGKVIPAETDNWILSF